ncbi:hypothetical protein BN59_00224 [Legionella massiliensis]|uniref:Uncharacterized protein n=1 Tax=Legionella massiliensis TaxID=1034943 RepID=A0A078KSN1_9GAMM|nr:hypothetical protein [Legionella massiliensis]CDZ75962.1 hypothetical protein BN59_00224 [Legionella massiliensis]CEE11700.1 hypothetical protein BN1094_00224 [Legionella massiliensis]
MKLKKIPYYLLLTLLTLGASLIIGFLSFTGMFTLAPILGLAIGSLILSVAYEGEIYLQNIKGALNKLFKRDFLKNQLGNDALLKLFENNTIDTEAEDCPQFFKDYQAQLKLLHKFDHKRLDEKSEKAKRQIEKKLKDMERWFASQLFAEEGGELTPYERELSNWLNESMQDKLLKAYRAAFDEEMQLDESSEQVDEWINNYLNIQFEKQTINPDANDCPALFKEYKEQLLALQAQQESDAANDEESDFLILESTRVDESRIQQEAKLKQMRQRFAQLMLANNLQAKNLTAPEQELLQWMQKNPRGEAKALYSKRETTYKWVIAFSAVSGFFMSLGITYLLVEAFSMLPILAAISAATLPAIIVPLALICGAAYTFLIYNAVTDMIHNDTLRKWYYKIRDDLKQGITLRSVSLAVSAVVLLSLTIALTVCTAGTWWTVAKNARPLFEWMRRMPSFIMGVVTPLFLGVSQLIFNLQNTSESLEMIDNATRAEEGFFARIAKGIADTYHHVMDNENWLQIINPFRLLLKLTVTPLRLLFFFGHLISIGVTADRVPGIPEIVSAILGIISEGFEDAHYFVGDLLHNHDHHHHGIKDLARERLGEGHGHSHDNDIPSRLLNFIFTPLYAAAAGWDYAATRMVNKTAEDCGLMQVEGEEKPSFDQLRETLQGKNAVVSHNNKLYYANQRTEKVKEIKLTPANQENYEALQAKCAGEHRFAQAEELESIASLTKSNKHSIGKELSWEESWDKQKGQPPKESVEIKPTAAKPSKEWQLEHSVHRIDQYLDKHLNQAKINGQLASEKAAGLLELRRDLRDMHEADEEEIKVRISQETAKQVYGQQRFFGLGYKTRTEDFLADLPERISSAPVA